MAILLALVSATIAFGAMALFIYWLMTTASSLYADGNKRIGGYVVANEDDPTSAIGLGNRLGLVFLPINEALRDRDLLGVGMMLAHWDHQLVRAGLRSQITAEQLLGLCQMSGLLVGFALAGLTVLKAPLFTALLLSFPVGLALGFFIPVLMVNNAASDRVAVIEKRLPFAIEFMLLAMEASAALPQAMAVYRDLMRDDPLADEFNLALADMDRGLSQVNALKALGERVDTDSVTAFLLAVNIGLDTGQPIKEVLQTQSDATRSARFQNAEEVAKTAGTRAIFPLFIVVLGILMLVLGPMAIQVMQGNFM